LDEAGASAPMLLATLEAFLDLAGDVQAVAKRLNLHRSSLYYRLDRIAKLADVDLADGLVRLDLHLALKARRVRRRTLR
jgi:DNA-binding PucR family transcriptional regulator